MKIPEVRERLLALAREIEPKGPTTSVIASRRGIWADEIRDLVSHLYRRPMANTIHRRVSVPMSHEMVMAIREMRKDHPDMTQTEIAHRLNISAGRVSEVLRGKRK